MSHIYGKVRRAYLKCPFFLGEFSRVLVQISKGCVSVFQGKGNGWICYNPKDIKNRLVFLPGETDHYDWWDGWWETNYRMKDWVPRVCKDCAEDYEICMKCGGRY